jgi:hypothetical protein
MHNRPHTEEAKKKMSLTRKGRVPWNKGFKYIMTPELKSKFAKGRLGKKWSPEMREKIMAKLPKGVNNHFYGKNFSGENSPLWIHNRSKLAKRQERNDTAYMEWRSNVYRRDGFKCKIGNCDCKGRIEAHHILGWTEFPELRYGVNNGITLCHFHHPRVVKEVKRLSPYFQDLVSVTK